MRTISRRSAILVVGVLSAVAIAIPVWAASPTPGPDPSSQSQPEKTAKPDKTAMPEDAMKPDEAPELAVTAHGTVKATTDANGRSTYTLTDGAKTWDLSDGPPWFWGDKDPLKAYVGKTVTVIGTTETGGTEIDVSTVDGKAIRAPGKPPWAGGPWVVGPTHPGWKSWMAGGKPGKGGSNAPGKTKDDTSGKTQDDTIGG
jgi:hypothetical protein